MRAVLSLLMGEPVPQAVSVPLPEANTDELEPDVNFYPDARTTLHYDLHPPLRGEPHVRGDRRAAGLVSPPDVIAIERWRLHSA